MTAQTALSPLLTLEVSVTAPAPPALKTVDAAAADARTQLMTVPGLNMHGNEEVAMLLYPGFTALDLVGPHYFFASMMGARVHLVTTTDDLSPVPSDLGLAIAPTATLADCPKDLTVLFAPGGTTGTLAAASDPGVRAFVADRASRATCVTSVCTGSLLLGAAGVLKPAECRHNVADMD